MGNRPRAVLVVLGDQINDTSAYASEEVLRFLRDLRVPLFVWWTGRIFQEHSIPESRRALTQKTPWGRADDVSTFTRMMDASAKVRLALDQQLIVWIEGSHLPHEVDLAKGVRGIKPAG